MKRCKCVCYSIKNKEACFPKVQNSNNLAPAIVRCQSSVLHNKCALMKARATSWKSSHSQRNKKSLLFRYILNMQNSSMFLLSHIFAKWIIECWIEAATQLLTCRVSTLTLPNCRRAIPRRQKAWLIFPIKLQKSIILVDGTLTSLTISESPSLSQKSLWLYPGACHQFYTSRTQPEFCSSSAERTF